MFFIIKVMFTRGDFKLFTCLKENIYEVSQMLGANYKTTSKMNLRKFYFFHIKLIYLKHKYEMLGIK